MFSSLLTLESWATNKTANRVQIWTSSQSVFLTILGNFYTACNSPIPPRTYKRIQNPLRSCFKPRVNNRHLRYKNFVSGETVFAVNSAQLTLKPFLRLHGLVSRASNRGIVEVNGWNPIKALNAFLIFRFRQKSKLASLETSTLQPVQKVESGFHFFYVFKVRWLSP